MKIVALLSGGLDSTAMCYHLLTNYQYPIHIHHIQLNYHTEDNGGHRTECERLATANVVEWLKTHCRSFEYSETNVDFHIPGYPRHPNDHLWTAFIGYNLLNKGLGDVLSTGRIATDCNAGGTPSIMSAYGVFEALCKDPMGRTWTPPGKSKAEKVKFYWVCPVIEWTKATAFYRVPSKLLDLTVSCRFPRFVNGEIRECKKCRTCKRKSQAKNMVRSNRTEEEVNEWLLKNPPVFGKPAGPKYYEGYIPWPITLEEIEKEEEVHLEKPPDRPV